MFNIAFKNFISSIHYLCNGCHNNKIAVYACVHNVEHTIISHSGTGRHIRWSGLHSIYEQHLNLPCRKSSTLLVGYTYHFHNSVYSWPYSSATRYVISLKSYSFVQWVESMQSRVLLYARYRSLWNWVCIPSRNEDFYINLLCPLWLIH